MSKQEYTEKERTYFIICPLANLFNYEYLLTTLFTRPVIYPHECMLFCDQEADMAVGFFTISPERSKVADASSAFFYDNARILFRKRKQAQEPRSVFLGTFTGPLYLLLAGLFLGVVVMLTFIEWCAWCLQAEPTAAPTNRRRFLSRTLAGTEGMLAGLQN